MTYFLNGTRGFNSPAIIPPHTMAPFRDAPCPTLSFSLGDVATVGVFGLALGAVLHAMVTQEPDKEGLESRR